MTNKSVVLNRLNLQNKTLSIKTLFAVRFIQDVKRFERLNEYCFIKND
jgi:hypothetical protein